MWAHEFKAGDAAISVDIALTGARSLTLLTRGDFVAFFAEPTLTTGKPVPSNLIAQLVSTLIDARTAAQAANDTVTVDLINKRFKDLNIEVNVTAGAVSWQFR